MNKENLRRVLKYLLESESDHFEECFGEPELLKERNIEIITSVDTSKEKVNELIEFLEEREMQEEHIYYDTLILLKDYLNLK